MSPVMLTLKTENNVSHMTLQLMLYHHTKFGYKRFTGVEDIIQTNINCYSNPIFSLNILAYHGNTSKHILVAKESLVQKVHLKQSYSDHMSPHSVTAILTLKVATFNKTLFISHDS